MKILPVTDPSFQNYGQSLTGYDVKDLLATLDKVTPLPEGVEYVPEQESLMDKTDDVTISKKHFRAG